MWYSVLIEFDLAAFVMADAVESKLNAVPGAGGGYATAVAILLSSGIAIYNWGKQASNKAEPFSGPAGLSNNEESGAG